MKFLRAIALATLSLALATGAAAQNDTCGETVLVNSIAAGDTTFTSTVLWARSTVPGKVRFEVAYTPLFLFPFFRAQVDVDNTLTPAKVAVNRLLPGIRYFYRVTAPNGEKKVGTFTTPSLPGRHRGLRFGITGDWRGELSPYPSVKNAPSRNLDFFVEFGDTIYADVPSPDLPKEQATSLEEYRIKNNEVYSCRHGLNTLGKIRSLTSIHAVIDDHEVTNDFAGGAPPSSDPRFDNTGAYINETMLYQNGLKAFQEYNPLRSEFYGNTGDPRTAGKRKLYRYRTFGGDAALFITDQRSFRDQELVPANITNPADVVRFGVQAFDPTRTLLGRQQLADLAHDLLDAQYKGITWKFVLVPEPIQNLGPLGASDRYEGYAAERTALLKFITDAGIKNVVFVTADIHGTLVNNLTYQLLPFGPQFPTNTFEISTGAVAYDAPFGPTVVQLAGQAGLLTPQQVGFYNLLPLSFDSDSAVNDKDDFVKSLVDQQVATFGYDTIGLAGSSIPATLLQGDYVSMHTYGWTEFDIDKRTQKLTITTYGIPYYTEAELNANPAAVTARNPEVVSQIGVAATK
jgi:phosphodiesterase/alkaline phosphatase D-like protein